MSLLENKEEELKQRRSDILNGIVTSRADLIDINTQDNLADNYLFGGGGNPVGVLYLTQLYQQERTCEKDVVYHLASISNQANIEGKIWSDISNIMNSSAEPPRYSPNYFYYIDGDYNISINDGSFPTVTKTKTIEGRFKSINTFKADDSFNEVYVGDKVTYTNGDYDYEDEIKKIDGKTITLVRGYGGWQEEPIRKIKDIQYFKSKNGIMFNNGETNPLPEHDWAWCLENDIGSTFTDKRAVIDGGSDPYTKLEEDQNRGSGFLKYWGSNNQVKADPFQEDQYDIGGDNKIWIWHTTTIGSYKTQEHIASLLHNLKGLSEGLNRLSGILTNIKNARNAIEENSYWKEMPIAADESSDNIQNRIDLIDSWKSTFINSYNTLKDEKENNYDWTDDETPSSDNFTRLNGAISPIADFSNYSNLSTLLNERFNIAGNVLTSSKMTGLYKWINFWLTEKISLENGSYSSIYFLTQSLNDDERELKEADQRLKDVFGANNLNVVPRTNILAVYSDPKIDKTTGKTLQKRLGIVWDGQLHAKQYHIERKDVRAFNYYVDNQFAFKWDNSEWPSLNQKGNASYDIIEVDPEANTVKTEDLKEITDDEVYIFRVKEIDVNNSSGSRPIDYNDPNYLNKTVYSKQSKMYDDDNPQVYSNITNGVVKIKNHPFKRGNFVLLKSSIKDSSVYRANPINGFYRIVDADEDTFVLDNLINTASGGEIFKAFGVVTAKSLPYVSYDENGKPSLVYRS